MTAVCIAQGFTDPERPHPFQEGDGLPAGAAGAPTTQTGGHYTVELAVRAQFGAGFRELGVLRRRRHELEYPAVPGDATDEAEAAEAIGTADWSTVARALPDGSIHHA